MFKFFCVFILFLFLTQVRTLDEGQPCIKDGVSGTCIRLKNCQAAIDDIRHQKRPQQCTFVGREPVVCCIDNAKPSITTPLTIKTTIAPPVATTTKKRITTSTRAPLVYDYEEDNGKCEALSPTLTSKRTGNKSWDKCIDYQETLVYPCTTGVDLTAQLSRSNKCGHNTDELIIGGESAAVGEFPHMALIGYGEPDDDQWLCGGTLISDRFVLTAGHCISYRNTPASNIAVGVYKRSTIDKSKVYKIQDVIKHPEYKAPLKYNDIALLKTEKSIKLDQTVVPACLPAPVPGSGSDEKALATGWGAVEYRGDVANILQKVILTKFPRDECSVKFPTNRLMPRGFDPDTQICYGDKTKSKDTCQGDSGGPLQIRNKLLHCMYTVVGVTSFGKACGFVGDPGIYTRVQNYLPWIEPIVWG